MLLLLSANAIVYSKILNIRSSDLTCPFGANSPGDTVEHRYQFLPKQQKICHANVFHSTLVAFGPRCVGAGHVVHPVHSVRSARDPREAAEEPEHGPQQ